MNTKQIAVIIIGIVGIAAVTYFTPRYKIILIDSENYIKTEQTSSLYKRSAGKEKLHWDKIVPISGGILLLGGILIFLLREKKKNG
jgi:hypothetical protein